jgi:uncharacterized protein
MTMGRMAIELPYVMPDKRTVYITDDGDNTMLGMFHAAEAGDLSCGKLYAAKMKQTSAEGGGEFDVEMIEVGGHACTDMFAAKASTIKFHDMFDTADMAEDGSCMEGFTAINTQPGGAECLRLKPGMDLFASRFEFRRCAPLATFALPGFHAHAGAPAPCDARLARRLAAMKGATTEFTKMEGITYDFGRNRLYVAMSSIRGAMQDGAEEDLGGPNHVRVPENDCGCGAPPQPCAHASHHLQLHASPAERTGQPQHACMLPCAAGQHSSVCSVRGGRG